MKLLVVGNCQSRPLAKMMQVLIGAEYDEPIVLHRATAAEADAHTARLEAADLVLAQMTSDAFEPAHLRSDLLADRYPGKVAVWPNLFYAGQQPFLRYMTHPDCGRLNSPLDVYHDGRIFYEWRVARGMADGSADLEDIARRVRETSLAVLQKREAECTVGVSDAIAEEEGNRRLFYTFNHPANWLLELLARRLCDHLGLRAAPGPAARREFLDIVLPPSVAVNGAGPQPISGFETELRPGGQVASGTRTEFTPESLRAAAFRCYDHIATAVDLTRVRRTPDYGGDAALFS